MTAVTAYAAGRTAARPVERVCYAVGALLTLAGAVHFGVWLVDGGAWDGPVSWRKPTTFGLSFGLTLVSVVWVTSYLRMPERRRRWLLGVFAADCVVEVGGITLQAWRGVPSHFNRESAFDSAVSTVLAVGGVVLVVVLSVFAVRAFRGDPASAASMRWAQRAGWATMVVALASGAAMIARGVVESNAVGQEAAYAAGGFLKPVHAVSMHGVLVLPLLAWALSRVRWPEERRVRVVAAVSGAYAVAVVVALVVSLTEM
ncbi:hypothetical protein RKD23_001656 [Streptomyces sp. SAI-170]|uniref:hypothetical protein n=1 Tax=Streptomyces sp. SAI-170 TaxID=3377729 RepID=UPI003C79EFB8